MGRHGSERRIRESGNVATIITTTAGNFRLIGRLMAQVRRIKELNQLNTVAREVLDAPQDYLVIGTA